MVVVGGVAVIVMHVVDVVAMLHRHVAAARLVLVLMGFMHNMDHVVALVVVAIVRPVDVAVVKVVRVVSMPKRGMPAVWAVLMGVVGVGPMHLHGSILSRAGQTVRWILWACPILRRRALSRIDQAVDGRS